MIALVVALITVLTIPTVAFAANQTVLTTTAPAATYTLNVPADQEIPFGTESIEIKGLSITDPVGFAQGKNIEVSISYDSFTCPDVNTKIPFSLALVFYQTYTEASREITSGDSLLFKWNYNKFDAIENELPFSSIKFVAKSSDWGKALAGEYTATITFTAEVVAE